MLPRFLFPLGWGRTQSSGSQTTPLLVSGFLEEVAPATPPLVLLEVTRAVCQRLDRGASGVLMCWCLLMFDGGGVFPFLAGPSLALSPDLSLSACLCLSSCVS